MVHGAEVVLPTNLQYGTPWVWAYKPDVGLTQRIKGHHRYKIG
jgi:hypothetical protein